MTGWQRVGTILKYLVGFIIVVNIFNAANARDPKVKELEERVSSLAGQVDDLDGKVRNLDGKVDELQMKVDNLPQQ